MRPDKDIRGTVGRCQLHIVFGRRQGGVRQRLDPVIESFAASEDPKHTRHGFSRPGSYGEFGMRVGRANERRVGLTGQAEIVAEPALADQ